MLAPLAASLILAAVPPQGPEPAFEVLVLGTYHAPAMFRGPAYTPAHIGAALAAAQPDVVAVETDPTWLAHGRYHSSTYEAQGVAVPVARERGIPVHGVDSKDIEAWDRREERWALAGHEHMQELVASGEPLPLSHFGDHGGAEGSAPPDEVDWRQINSDERARALFRSKSPDDDDFAPVHDRGIADNCVRLMRDHPGKRLVVVIGAFHKVYLDTLLARRGVRVLQLGADVPFPSDEEVRAAWTSSQLVAALGHNLDSGSAYFRIAPAAVERMAALLALLEQRGEHPEAARYFRARLQFAAGDMDACERGLDALLADGAEGILYPFPLDSWRMRYSLSEAVRLEKARVLLRRGKPAEAAPLLRQLHAALGFRLQQLEITQPRELRRDDAVDDWDFETGERGPWPDEGWWTFLPTGQGRLAFDGDEQIKTEGQRSLRIEITEARPQHPFHLQQAFEFPVGIDVAGLDAFELDLRGEGIDQVKVLLDPPNKRAGVLGDTTIALHAGAWTRARIPLPLSDARTFTMALAFTGAAGSKLWLDGGTRLRFAYMTVPREWQPLALAREFPRSLLELAGK